MDKIYSKRFKGDKMKRYLKHIWFFILAFIPQLAWAGNSANDIINQSWSSLVSFTPTPADWSMRFLGQVFGSVGTVLTGAQRTIIGELFGIFNAAMMALVAILIMYIVIKVILEACILGPEMGKKIGAWVMLRTAIGVSMLVPFKTGYSIIQVIIMWAVVQGVGLADHTWIAAVDFLREGGGIFVTSQQAMTDMSPDVTKSRTLDTVGDVPNPLEPTSNSQQQQPSNPDKVGTTDVLRSLVCMHVVEDAINTKYQNTKEDMINHPTKYPREGTAKYSELMNKYNQNISLQPKYDETNYVVIIPWVDKNNPNYDDLKQFNGACGVYDWNVASFTGTVKDNTCPDGTHECGVTKDQADQMTTGYMQAKELGVKGMVSDLDQLAVTLVKQAKNNNNNNQVAPGTSNGDMVANAAATYQTTIWSSASYASSLELRKSNNLNNIMTNYGWAAAGQYYTAISENFVIQGLNSKYNQDNYQISIASSYPDVHTPTYPPSTIIDSSRSGSDGLKYVEGILDQLQMGFDKALLENSLNFVDGHGSGDTSAIRYQAFMSMDKKDAKTASQYLGTAPLPDLSTSQFFKNESNIAVPNTIPGVHGDRAFPKLSKHLNEALDIWYNYMVNPQHDSQYDVPPMVKLQNVGESLMNGAYRTWVDVKNNIINTGTAIIASFGTAGIITSTASAITGNFLGLGSGGAALGAAMAAAGGAVLSLTLAIQFFTLPLVIAVTGPMFLTGTILSTYLPFVPFMFFTFGVISWLIFVVEAMAAAPLVAMGVTHPEGHDLMGKANQAIMLWLSVFLRPLAMIIGLIGGIVLFYVASEVLNAGFGGFVDILFMKQSPANQFQRLVIVLIYTFISVALVNQCFGMIYVIPEKIMRWIGLAPDHSDAPQLAESVKSGITPFIQATGEGAGKVAGESSKQVTQSAGQTAQVGTKTITAGGKAKDEIKAKFGKGTSLQQ